MTVSCKTCVVWWDFVCVGHFWKRAMGGAIDDGTSQVGEYHRDNMANFICKPGALAMM